MKEQNLQLFYLFRYDGVPIAIGIKVKPKEEQGSEFIISLPLKHIH